MELEKIEFDDARERVLKYLENYYMQTEMILRSSDYAHMVSAYTFGDMLIYGSPDYYFVFGFHPDGADALAELLAPGGTLNLFWDGGGSAETEAVLREKNISLIMNMVFLLKEGGGAPRDPDVFKLTKESIAEFSDFIEASLSLEPEDAIERVILPRLLPNAENVLQTGDQNERTDCFVIRHDGEIVGMRWVQFYQRLKNKAMGDYLYISPPFRGRGFAKRLLQASLTEEGYTYQYSCDAENTASLNTALSVGYRRAGMMSTYRRGHSV